MKSEGLNDAMLGENEEERRSIVTSEREGIPSPKAKKLPQLRINTEGRNNERLSPRLRSEPKEEQAKFQTIASTEPPERIGRTRAGGLTDPLREGVCELADSARLKFKNGGLLKPPLWQSPEPQMGASQSILRSRNLMSELLKSDGSMHLSGAGRRILRSSPSPLSQFIQGNKGGRRLPHVKVTRLELDIGGSRHMLNESETRDIIHDLLETP